MEEVQKKLSPGEFEIQNEGNTKYKTKGNRSSRCRVAYSIVNAVSNEAVVQCKKCKVEM